MRNADRWRADSWWEEAQRESSAWLARGGVVGGVRCGPDRGAGSRRCTAARVCISPGRGEHAAREGGAGRATRPRWVVDGRVGAGPERARGQGLCADRIVFVTRWTIARRLDP